MNKQMPSRVVVVCPTILDKDAVGNATLALVGDLTNTGRHIVNLITRTSDLKHQSIVNVNSLGELLLEPTFLAADIIIYVFAIYSDLFDAMLIGNGRAAQVVRFHNVTPKSFVSESDHAVIDLSIAQISNFSSVDEIWADSQENLEALVRTGIDDSYIRVMPLSVVPLALSRIVSKPYPDPLQILFVGRFVESKGIDDLITALGILKNDYRCTFFARLLGNTRHSNRSYLERLEGLISSFDLHDSIQMGGTVTRTALSDAYRAAHIVTTASRHEGFCVPIIEGMAAGCIPVTYSNSNLKHIAGGLGLLAREDTPGGLAEALSIMGDAIRGSALEEGPRALPLDRGAMMPKQFDAAAKDHVAKFDPAACAERIARRTEALVSRKGALAAAKAAG